MGKDLERLKQHFPLLEYLQRHHWTGRALEMAPSLWERGCSEMKIFEKYFRADCVRCLMMLQRLGCSCTVLLLVRKDNLAAASDLSATGTDFKVVDRFLNVIAKLFSHAVITALDE
jgi:hypothetical protein